MEDSKWAKHIGDGLCWLGFWIGLGLYNFQGCTPQAKAGMEIKRAWDEGTTKDSK